MDIELEDSLASWVMSHVDQWEVFYDTNFKSKHEEYERIWRGLWQEADRTRASERSKIVAPHTAQAVESAVAEVEEAIFGKGKLFTIEDDLMDEEKEDVALLRRQLNEDLTRRKVRSQISECILSGAVKGNGIAEIITKEITERKVASVPQGNVTEVGVATTTRTICEIMPVDPANFRIDPAATCVDDGLGVAIDNHYVPPHQVESLQAQGVYDDNVVVMPTFSQIEHKNQALVKQPEDTVRVTKYFGLVPRDLLKEVPATTNDIEDGENVETAGTDLVEAIVVILNGQEVLKAQANPYMMQDRPVVAFAWDTVPGLFYGRGVPEKGYSIQKSLDSELRARNDALALTAHPMMAVDGTKMPRGMQPKITPGRTIITQGNPQEALMPFNFGQVGQITFAQAESLGRMLQMATGSVDSTGVAGTVNNDAAASGISMSLGAVIKRQKRTLVNFQDDFLIPMIEKVAWRYMQYDPDNYPARDYKFNVYGSLGIMAREYEVTQLTQLLQSMNPESATYSLLLETIISNMSITDRDRIVATLQQARQPNPEQVQAQQAAAQAAMAVQQGQAAALQGQAAESAARARKYEAETLAIPVELQNEQFKIISDDLPEDATETDFKRRVELAKLMQADRAQDLEEASMMLANSKNQ
jgi:hypothetical protein